MTALAVTLLLALVSPGPGAWGGAGEAGRAPAPIAFDLDRINEHGLQGPPGGLRALHYEFCIPSDPEAARQVAAIDPSVQFMPGSRGRVGCAAGATLVLGHTHQPRSRAVLAALAGLPFVTRIVESFFE